VSPLFLADEGAHRGFLAGVELTALSPDARSEAPGAHALVHPSAAAPAHTQVVVGACVGLIVADACPACVTVLRARARGEIASPVAAGALAALLVQRQVLGFAHESTYFEWREGAFKPSAPPACAEHGKSSAPSAAPTGKS
jgi:hypothetical protein